ncbi:hypothetical protein [Intrasporangium flavum]|uniref:hypothetical protein n=1 Tax=Intrasporangium flavum TaxID=1428657 RepID=UPI00096CED0B|nr:hypothetical protein [Intrasporangium flavum]
MTTTTGRHAHPDLAHHHPRVTRTRLGSWTWECDCGSASARAALVRLTWRQAFIGALIHSASIAP